MKVTYRIPTQDQFAFVEIEAETEAVNDLETIKTTYDALTGLFRPKTGLPDKDYNKFVDSMLLGESNHLEAYNAMSDRQKETVQCLKRALARIKSKQERE